LGATYHAWGVVARNTIRTVSAIYDPALGQYLTQDPIGLAGGWNSFSYVKSPTTHIDPYGLTDISTPEVANQDGRGSSINKIIGAKKGGDRIANGARKMEGANKKEEEVLDCLMAGPTCKKKH